MLAKPADPDGPRTVRLSRHTYVLVSFIVLSLCTSLSIAQVPPPPKPYEPAPNLLKEIGIDQKLGDQVPLDLNFKDETGRAVHLGDYFSTKPVILTLVYYKCPSLCTMVLNDVLRSIRAMKLRLNDDFDIVTVSFDPTETAELAMAKKNQYVREYRRPGSEAGWHFLTGDAASIKALTRAVGYRYAWDDSSKTFAHASGVMVLTPGGKISRYFYGIDYAPTDLKLSLIEASNQTVGSPAERILLYCFHYDPRTGRYGLLVWRALRVGCTLTVLLLGSFIVHSLWRERHPALPRLNAQAGIDGQL